jgi:hypothetical protein
VTGTSHVATHEPSQTKLILEPAAQQLADATAGPPFLSELGYPAARKLLNDIQAGPVQKLPVDEEWVTVPGRDRRCPRADHQTPSLRGEPTGHHLNGQST